MRDWSRSEKIAFYSLLVGIVGVVAMLFTVPEFRRAVGLNRDGILNPNPPFSTPLGESNVANSPATEPRFSKQQSFTLKDALQEYKYEHGWSGGAANAGNITSVSYYAVTHVELNGNYVVMRYAWKNGILRGTINDREFTGTWQQSDGKNVEQGDLSLHFNDNFSQAEGQWKDSVSGESGIAYLRRTQ